MTDTYLFEIAELRSGVCLAELRAKRDRTTARVSDPAAGWRLRLGDVSFFLRTKS